jgi:uncharacterized protein (DUF433 family)
MKGVTKMPTLDWSQCPAVESVPCRLSGAWVFRNTRMPVSAVFENLEAGATIDEIVEQFDISRDRCDRFPSDDAYWVLSQLPLFSPLLGLAVGDGVARIAFYDIHLAVPDPAIGVPRVAGSSKNKGSSPAP